MLFLTQPNDNNDAPYFYSKKQIHRIDEGGTNKMTFDDGYNQCKKEVKQLLKEKKLLGIWEELELELK